MSRRLLLSVYVALSVLDFVATVFLVSRGYASEANPLINAFVRFFPTFSLGLAVYKTAMLATLMILLRLIHYRNPRLTGRLLVFANALMLALGVYHVACIRISLA